MIFVILSWEQQQEEEATESCWNLDEMNKSHRTAQWLIKQLLLAGAHLQEMPENPSSLVKTIAKSVHFQDRIVFASDQNTGQSTSR